MSAQVLLASRNKKKLIELRRILAPLVQVDVIGLDDVEAFDEIPESGATFAENALIKRSTPTSTPVCSPWQMIPGSPSTR